MRLSIVLWNFSKLKLARGNAFFEIFTSLWIYIVEFSKENSFVVRFFFGSCGSPGNTGVLTVITLYDFYFYPLGEFYFTREVGIFYVFVFSYPCFMVTRWLFSCMIS